VKEKFVDTLVANPLTRNELRKHRKVSFLTAAGCQCRGVAEFVKHGFSMNYPVPRLPLDTKKNQICFTVSCGGI
jgi:hypothetical protein